MSMESLQQLRGEQERILALPGRAAFVQVARLARTAKLFAGNADALIGHLNRMQDPTQRLPIWGDRPLFEGFLDETERHLHNYTAAAYTRMDYLQRFTGAEWPQSSTFREEYQRRVAEEFDASPLHNFVTDLRNLILQKRLPVSTTAESWEQGNGWRFQVMLDATDLLGWDGWSAQARKYIEASGDSVDLSRTVSAYTSAVITFDRWVAERFVEEHVEEIESYQHTVRDYRALVRRLGLRDDLESP
jgi:hypothetical protein